MSTVPTKRLESMVARARRNPGRWVLDKEYCIFMSHEGLFTIQHYSTIIYDMIDLKTITIGGAYSASDRDCINGMNILMGIPGRAYIKGHKLRYDPE